MALLRNAATEVAKRAFVRVRQTGLIARGFAAVPQEAQVQPVPESVTTSPPPSTEPVACVCVNCLTRRSLRRPPGGVDRRCIFTEPAETASSAVWDDQQLTYQISAHFAANKPQQEDTTERKYIVTRLYRAINAANASLSTLRLIPFGSAVNGFGAKGSDIDISIVAPPNTIISRSLLTRTPSGELKADLPAAVHQALRAGPASDFEVGHLIRTTKSTLCKLTYRPTNARVDLVGPNPAAEINTLLLRNYARMAPRTRVLAHVLRSWSEWAGVRGAAFGFPSTYAYNLLIIAHLQAVGMAPVLAVPRARPSSDDYNDPLREVEVIRPRLPDVDMTHAGLFRSFLVRQLELFDSGELQRVAVSVRLGGYVPAEDVTCGKPRTFARHMIEDPVETHLDLGFKIRTERQAALIIDAMRRTVIDIDAQRPLPFLSGATHQ